MKTNFLKLLFAKETSLKDRISIVIFFVSTAAAILTLAFLFMALSFMSQGSQYAHVYKSGYIYFNDPTADQTITAYKGFIFSLKAMVGSFLVAGAGTAWFLLPRKKR